MASNVPPTCHVYNCPLLNKLTTSPKSPYDIGAPFHVTFVNVRLVLSVPAYLILNALSSDTSSSPHALTKSSYLYLA